MNKWLWALLGVIILAGAGTGVYYMVRGIRNNNPGNIRYNSSINWKGQTGPDDGGYLIFDSSLNGIRALALLLKNYNRLYGLNTIAKIITRWAPKEDNNDTAAYISSVSQALNYPANAALDYKTHLLPLIKAIIKHENGIQPYDDDLIQQGIDLTKNA